MDKNGKNKHVLSEYDNKINFLGLLWVPQDITIFFLLRVCYGKKSNCQQFLRLGSFLFFLVKFSGIFLEKKKACKMLLHTMPWFCHTEAGENVTIIYTWDNNRKTYKYCYMFCWIVINEFQNCELHLQRKRKMFFFLNTKFVLWSYEMIGQQVTKH